MSLKLFRSTGYSSILAAGETSIAMHPGWLILATSVWVGFACNAVLWRQLRAPGTFTLSQVLVFGTFVAASCGLVLGILGWRNTLKPAATLILFVAALGVCAVEGTAPAIVMADMPPVALLLPSWNDLLHWQAWATLGGLALLPAVCIRKTRVRRLPGGKQFSTNVMCVLAAAMVLALSGLLLYGRLF
jgi:lipid A ethanolaminephosphotransferase